MVLFLISSVFFNSGNLYKTPDYSNADAQAVAVKTGLGYFALGLSKIGTELFMLAEDTAGYGNTTKIVKMDTAGNVIKEFDIVSEFQYGALGIAHTGAANEFFILARGSNDADNDTLIVKKLRLESSNSYEVVHEFKVTNRGYGWIYKPYSGYLLPFRLRSVYSDK